MHSVVSNRAPAAVPMLGVEIHTTRRIGVTLPAIWTSGKGWAGEVRGLLDTFGFAVLRPLGLILFVTMLWQVFGDGARLMWDTVATWAASFPR